MKDDLPLFFWAKYSLGDVLSTDLNKNCPDAFNQG